MATSKGYDYKFKDSVPEDFYCKKCNLVARKLTVAECCGESFCYVCISDTQKQGEPCPECGEEEFTTYRQVKIQKKINNLQVYCSMKERGCEWSGPLEQMDTHLDPDQDNCQYVNIKCPHCHIEVPKNKIGQHVSQHCTKRPHVCQHCNFKATYEEIVGKHLAECKFVPLQCPNLCGVSFERDFKEDHMKICRLEEVVCEFRGVGCKDHFKREDQEEHIRQNSQKHLTLTASLVVETNNEFQRKLLVQDKEYKEEREEMKEKIQEQEAKITKQEEKLELQEKQLIQQSKVLNELEKKLIDQENERTKVEQKLNKKMEKKLKEQKELTEQFHLKWQKLEQLLAEVTAKSVQYDKQLSIITKKISPYQFKMKNFDLEKTKDKFFYWKSPAMYTHLFGYKFCIGVDANGYEFGCGELIRVGVWTMSGEFDSQLKWPVKAKFTIELINQAGGKNVMQTITREWNLPTSEYHSYSAFSRTYEDFVAHSELNCFLKNDTLYFHVSSINLL